MSQDPAARGEVPEEIRAEDREPQNEKGQGIGPGPDRALFRRDAPFGYYRVGRSARPDLMQSVHT